MTDTRTLLQQHRPLLRYDKQEVYFADSARIWTDGPEQVLRNDVGALLAAAKATDGQAQLSLGFLRPGQYETGTVAAAKDRVGCTGRDYPQQARRLHMNPDYRNRMYGRSATGSDGRLWLQYWFFYFYNDYNLIGPFLPAGLHEGDWEMVQLRLDEAGTVPDLAVYAAHKEASARAWAHVERVGSRPVVYPARGSHASYFTPGTHWTGVWFDHADGAGFSPDIALDVIEDGNDAFRWAHWPGFWGDTRPTGAPADAYSPSGLAPRKAWRDPVALLLTAKDHDQFLAQERGPAPAVPVAPQLGLAREGDALKISYASAGWPAGAEPAQLVVTLNSPDDTLPPTPDRIAISSPSGTVALPGVLRSDQRYDVTVSVADAEGLASESTRETLPKP
jgi:hypothetical protein